METRHQEGGEGGEMTADDKKLSQPTEEKAYTEEELRKIHDAMLEELGIGRKDALRT